MIFIFLLCNHFSFVKFISIRVSVKCFVIKILRVTFSWDPSMTFWLFISLFSERINFFLKSKELIFEKFRALFVTCNNPKIFCNKLFVIFYWILENFIEEFPQIYLLSFYSHVNKLTGLFFQIWIEKPFLFDLNILTFFRQLLNLFCPLSNCLTGVYDVI